MKSWYDGYHLLNTGDVYNPNSVMQAIRRWNKSAKGAIDQIKDKKYPDALKDYGGDVLLVGINYEKDAPVGERKHTCVIEKMKFE